VGPGLECLDNLSSPGPRGKKKGDEKMEELRPIGDSNTMHLRGFQFTLDMVQRDLWEFCKEKNVPWGDARERIRQTVGILSLVVDKMDDDLMTIERLDEYEPIGQK
jgi:hypothetical protein